MNPRPALLLVSPSRTAISHTAKRTMDVVGATLGIVLLTPLVLAAALVVCLTSPGPPLFRQRRVGRDGREFGLLKLRTMVQTAEEMRAQLLVHSKETAWLALDADPRVTPIGRLLRRTSIDELPQLINVLRGEMSIVGPRPLPVEEQAVIPECASSRGLVRPGLTGLWQVAGRADISFQEMLLLDCEYVRAWSLWTDVKIMLRTIPAVVRGKGAH